MSEFDHYVGCKGKDLDNCSACALLKAGINGPNYAGWPLAFVQAGREIPKRYYGALAKELSRTDNPSYVNNLKRSLPKQLLDEVSFK